MRLEWKIMKKEIRSGVEVNLEVENSLFKNWIFLCLALAISMVIFIQQNVQVKQLQENNLAGSRK